ncbi:MAG TPA: response regulator [Longimicrobium sp.]|nr:response regulator [Longimicrobium sp.]
MSHVTVLIVDDDADQHTLCGVFLQHAGYTVLHAFDGQEGVEMARAHLPALVLMDIRMPRMDGITARQALAADPLTARIPVVALSADVLTWPERRVMQEGFAAHLPKPCNLDRISALVQRLIRVHAAPGFVANPGTALAV